MADDLNNLVTLSSGSGVPTAPVRLRELRGSRLAAQRPAQRRRGGDRTYRSLASLASTASTSRVLNLIQIRNSYAHLAEYADWPMFVSPTLNDSIIVKHRLRSDEQDLFDDARQVATKIILPFSRYDLSLGAQSMFVGARGWADFVGNISADVQAFNHNRGVLEVLDQLPSLDPFLVREALRLGGFHIAPCYFALSEADAARMYEFVSAQIQKLIRMAINNGQYHEARGTARLVDALLSSEVDDRLEPLRATLALDQDSFQEGIFCWKGFLYYKWALASICDDLAIVMDEIDRLALTGQRDREAERSVVAARERIKRSVQEHQRSLATILRFYDDAFDDLTQHGQPSAFRDFLLRAPSMFVRLGEKTGGIAHVSSFWRYRFPVGAPLRATVHEAVELFSDFEDSVCVYDAAGAGESWSKD
ncbi:MAG TPA: hypothetical protein VMU59_10165 [Caulobacteraceae bacterium]|nr:hypothetical protein [Caulobacteraceae bacterium]